MKLQKYITITLCSLFVLFFSFWCFFIPTPDYSDSERRALTKMPEITLENITSGKFAKDFESYTTDHFPLRDKWRSIKAYTRLFLLGQKENNGIYLKNGHISKIDYPLNQNMLDYAISLFSKINQKHLQNSKVYFAMIPDKNRFLADLKYDYDALEKYMQKGLSFATPIEISHLLSQEDYYFTDSHWRQEKITDVARFIAQSMGTDLTDNYTELRLDTPFNGVYSGQSALNPKPDTIKYLTNPTIKNLKVSGAQNVYDFKKANGKDPYEFFLSGNQPIVKISNLNNNTGKSLVVFRDSYASSIMPLLAEAYTEITMIDLRYLNSVLLEQLNCFDKADVLFLYSSTILNNSTSMK